ELLDVGVQLLLVERLADLDPQVVEEGLLGERLRPPELDGLDGAAVVLRRPEDRRRAREGQGGEEGQGEGAAGTRGAGAPGARGRGGSRARRAPRGRGTAIGRPSGSCRSSPLAGEPPGGAPAGRGVLV